MRTRNVLTLVLLAFVLGVNGDALAGHHDAPEKAAQEEGTAPTVQGIIERMRSGDLPDNPLFLPTAERRVVFASTEYFAPVRGIVPTGNPYPLSEAPEDLSGVTYQLGGNNHTLGEFLARKPLMGFLVVRDGVRLLEHYAPDHRPDTRWVSFSIAKSVTSLLVGAAVEDGYITSLDDAVTDYIPRLRGSAYEDVSVRHLLQMASGVAWNEDYSDPESDVAQAGAAGGVALTDYLATLPRAHPPGSHFNYNTGEANLTGELLRSAIGNNASAYLTGKIWGPFGMEFDATWLNDAPNSGETGGCCLNASLRDYARLGIFALDDGVLPSGERVLPEEWMAASVAPSPAAAQYGYMWWRYPGGRYNAGGIYGQKIFVDPQTRTVIAVHSNAETATGSVYAAHLEAVLMAVTDALREAM